jgi:hypothetical protein
MAFGMCALLAGAGIALASPTILWVLTPIAALAALFPVHPFDLIYNYGIRYLRNTGPLPKRRAQSRFACGVGAVWLVATAWAFQSGALITGYILGGALTGIAVLVSTTDICIPSMVYNALFLRSRTGDVGNSLNTLTSTAEGAHAVEPNVAYGPKSATHRR